MAPTLASEVIDLCDSDDEEPQRTPQTRRNEERVAARFAPGLMSAKSKLQTEENAVSQIDRITPRSSFSDANRPRSGLWAMNDGQASVNSHSPGFSGLSSKEGHARQNSNAARTPTNAEGPNPDCGATPSPQKIAPTNILNRGREHLQTPQFLLPRVDRERTSLSALARDEGGSVARSGPATTPSKKRAREDDRTGPKVIKKKSKVDLRNSASNPTSTGPGPWNGSGFRSPSMRIQPEEALPHQWVPWPSPNPITTSPPKNNAIEPIEILSDNEDSVSSARLSELSTRYLNLSMNENETSLPHSQGGVPISTSSSLRQRRGSRSSKFGTHSDDGGADGSIFSQRASGGTSHSPTIPSRPKESGLVGNNTPITRPADAQSATEVTRQSNFSIDNELKLTDTPTGPDGTDQGLDGSRMVAANSQSDSSPKEVAKAHGSKSKDDKPENDSVTRSAGVLSEPHTSASPHQIPISAANPAGMEDRNVMTQGEFSRQHPERDGIQQAGQGNFSLKEQARADNAAIEAHALARNAASTKEQDPAGMSTPFPDQLGPESDGALQHREIGTNTDFGMANGEVTTDNQPPRHPLDTRGDDAPAHFDGTASGAHNNLETAPAIVPSRERDVSRSGSEVQRMDEACAIGENRETITTAQLKKNSTSGTITNSDDKVNSDIAMVEMGSAEINALSFPAMGLSQQVERVLGKYLEEYRYDNEYWTRFWLRQAWHSLGQRSRAVSNVSSRPASSATVASEEPYSFKKWKPISLHSTGKSASSGHAAVMAVERKVASGKVAKSTLIVRVSAFRPQDDMPNYAHYVSIKSNFLAPNVRNMHHWPYFEDDFSYHEAESICQQYRLDIRPRRRKLLRLQHAQALESYAESALQDLHITWADVLRYLFEIEPDVGTDLDAVKALGNREKSCDEDFSRTEERAVVVLSSLPSSAPEKLAKAASLCENFLKMAKISLWHIARKHQPDTSPRAVEQSHDDMLDSLTCRICLRLDCPYHGEIRELESDDEVSSEINGESAAAMDIVNPPQINYRTRITFPPSAQRTERHEITQVQKKDRRALQYWQSNFVYKNDERGPFYPCHHPGKSCEDERCSCYKQRLPCEKYCTCPPDCPRKFQGCACTTSRMRRGQRVKCFEDERCICFMLGRECDPDLCGPCGVSEVIDPIHRYNNEILEDRCRNAGIQRGVPKRTIIGKSGIHGLGLFIGEDVDTHDFVGEYKGEIITKEEAERRGAVYEYQKLSYLFTLNATQEIDSTYFGNKIRFINHAGNGKNNLYPRIFLVDSVHRIALYAERPLKAGEELFFDYGPTFPNEQLGGVVSNKSAPRVRNSKTMRDAEEVEFEEDEHGNRRARKALRLKGRSKKPEARNSSTSAKKRVGGRPVGGKKSRKTALQSEEEMEEDINDESIPGHGSAGARLSAYNISDGVADAMEIDAGMGADEDFEPSEGNGNSENDRVQPEDGVSGRFRQRLGTRRGRR